MTTWVRFEGEGFWHVAVGGLAGPRVYTRCGICVSADACESHANLGAIHGAPCPTCLRRERHAEKLRTALAAPPEGTADA